MRKVVSNSNILKEEIKKELPNKNLKTPKASPRNPKTMPVKAEKTVSKLSLQVPKTKTKNGAALSHRTNLKSQKSGMYLFFFFLKLIYQQYRVLIIFRVIKFTSISVHLENYLRENLY